MKKDRSYDGYLKKKPISTTLPAGVNNKQDEVRR
jgi:hypothetical protein